MGNYQTTQYNHFDRCRRRLTDLFSKAESYHVSHEQLLEWRRKDLFESNSWKRLPRWSRSHLHGMEEMLSHNVYRSGKVVWRHFWIDKNGNVKWADKWDKMPKSIRYDREMFWSAHVWAKTNDIWSIGSK